MSKPRVLFVCTGNAARSVMAVVMARSRTAELEIVGGGTHSIEGLPMSQRTRRALAAYGLSDPDHLSHQMVAADTERADLIAVFEPNHLSYIQRRHSPAAARTAMLPGWLRVLQDAQGLGLESLGETVAALDLANRTPDADEEVIDPAGGDQDTFDASAAEISLLIDTFLDLLGVHNGTRHEDQFLG